MWVTGLEYAIKWWNTKIEWNGECTLSQLTHTLFNLVIESPTVPSGPRVLIYLA